MFNRSWGVQAEVPYAFRYFKTKDDAGDIVSRNWSQLGDIRIRGIYTGFMADLSAGVTFGVKLPTGSHTFDPHVVDAIPRSARAARTFCSGVFTVTIWIAIKMGLVCSVATGYSGADSGSVSSGCGTRCGGGN